MSVASLQFMIAITRFLSAKYLDKYFVPFHHNKILALLTLLRSLETVFVQFFIGQFCVPAKICLPLLAKTVCKALLTNHSGWTLDSDHVRRSHHSMTSFVRLNSNHKLRSTNQNASFTLFTE